MQKLKLRLSNQPLLKNTSWLLSTEMTAKISRVLVIFALAANLTAIEYGTVMLTLACHEVFKLMLRSGAGMQVIQCAEALLPDYAKNAAVLQWLVCLTLAIMQVALAIPLASFYDNGDVATLLSLMAGVYLLYPLVSVKVFLVQRANNMRFYSIRNAMCILVENLSISLFAVLGFGMMSVVYGMWAFAILWVCLFYFAPVKSFGLGFKLNTFLALCKTSTQLLSTELVRALRMQADSFIGARLLSPELFGIYAFAKSAGVGLSQSLSNAFGTAVYPYLCDKYRHGNLKQHAFKAYLAATVIASIFVIQALAAPIYVPFIFEQQWQQNYSIVTLLVLAAVPGIYVDTRCHLLRAQSAYQKELYVRLFCLFVSIFGLLILSANTPQYFAITILTTSTVWLLVLIPWRMLDRQIIRLKSSCKQELIK